MNKTRLFLCTALAFSLIIFTNVIAQDIYVNMDAEVLVTLSGTVQQYPGFGKFSVGDAGGTVSTDGIGSGTVVPMAGSDFRDLIIFANGTANTAFMLNIPAATLINQNSAEMTTDAVDVSDTLDGSGVLAINSVLVLNVGTNQDSGLYNGTVIASLHY